MAGTTAASLWTMASKDPAHRAIVVRVNIDDPGEYENDPLDHLRYAGQALDLYDDGDNSSYAFGDGVEAEAWIVPVREYDELARAASWVLARAALDPDGEDPVAQAAYEEATWFALHLDEPGHEFVGMETIRLATFVDSLPEIIDAIRSGRFEAVALTRDGAPEAVLLTHQEYRELLRAVLEWHRSDPFLSGLDKTQHHPLAKSQRIDGESLAEALGPTAQEVWREIQEERRHDSGRAVTLMRDPS